MSSSSEKEAEEQELTPEQARPIIECLLFTVGEPLSPKRLSRVLSPLTTKEIRRLILDLREEYDEQGRGFQIVELAGGYQMASRQTYAPYVLKLNRHKKRSPLTTPALETLAIIAYKQPIIRADIEAIRGVDASGVLRNLLELNLVKVVGKKDVIGRPSLYGTTDEFLKVFGLRKLSDLPSIKELRESFENSENK